MNGETIRSYYSFADPTKVRYPIELKVVENEFGQYTTFVHSRKMLDFNSFVSSASTNDSYIYKTMLTDIYFPNDLEFSITHGKTPIYMGDGGYEEATPITATHYRYDDNDITQNRNHYKFTIGDYTGYTTGFCGDDTYTTIETLSHNKSAPDGNSIWSWNSTQTSYTFNSEHELYIHEVKTYDTKPEDSISSTNDGLYAGIQGTANITTYSYTDAHLVSYANVKTYEPGSTSSFVEQNYYYTYDNKGNILTERLPNNQTITYTYSPEYSILLTKTYNQNNSTSIVEQNLLTADKKAIAQEQVLVNGTLGAKRTFSYNTNGQVAAINTYTSASQYTTQQFSYNNSAQPTQIRIDGVKDADNTSASATSGFGAGTIAEKTTYNSRGWPTSYTDGNGKVTSISYDAAGRITQVSYPNGGTESYVYDLENNTVTYTDIKNNVFTYSYNPYGDLEEIFDETSQQALATYHYDSVGNMDLETIHSTDSTKDKVTYYHYDNLKRPIEVGIRNSDGTSTPLETYTYNAASGKTTHTVIGSGNAPSQVNTTYVDKMGNTIMRGRFLNGSEFVDTYTYDYLGNCIKFVSAYMANQSGSPSAQYTYDYAGNMLSETDPLGNTKTYTYDWSGNLVQSRDAKQNTTTNSYDALGRLVKTTTPIDTNYNNVVKYYYDGAGNVTKQLTSTGTAHTNGTPSNYDSVLYTYDSMNRLTAVETPISSSVTDYTTYTYDLAGNITQMNAGGRKNGSTITSTPSTTTYTYDQFGNVLTEKNAANATESYTYDLNGAMLTKTDRKGVQSLYSYDNRGRMLSETIGSGAAQLVHSYTYGLNGSLLSESQSGNTITYKYDELGRLTQEYTAPFYKNYTYNIADLRTSFTLKENSSSLIDTNYFYDASGRLTGTTDYENFVLANYAYDANSNVTDVTYGNDAWQNFTYNAANQITTAATPTDSSLLTVYMYSYDLAGRQINVMDTAMTTTTYTYDTKGQLTAENRTGGTSAQNYSKTYTYDPRGNRITLANSNTSTSYTYNAVNRLQNSVTSGTTTTYTYDNNGNTLTDKVGSATATTYAYNADDQLTGVSGTTTASYTYYPNGLRKTKTVNGVTTTYVWDGDQLVYESGVTAAKYIRGLSLIARVIGSSREYYLFDGHGNVVGLATSADTLSKSYEYDAFGNQLNIDPADTNPFRYCGEYYDAETGSYYLRARYYDSSIGRFTQEDPHWNTGNMVYGDDPTAMSRGMLDLKAEYYLPSVLAMRQSGNLYAYCVNDPITYIDPNGNALETVLDIASIGISAIDLFVHPSWVNFGFLAWDVASTILPGIPGSYVYKGTTVLEGVSGLKKFTKGHFRENLTKLIGEAPSWMQHAEAHHVLPQKFIDWFAEKGLDIHDPRFGTWVESTPHHKWSNAYNKDWKNFISKNKSATGKEIIDFARELAEKYKFDINF